MHLKCEVVYRVISTVYNEYAAVASGEEIRVVTHVSNGQKQYTANLGS